MQLKVCMDKKRKEIWRDLIHRQSVTTQWITPDLNSNGARGSDVLSVFIPNSQIFPTFWAKALTSSLFCDIVIQHQPFCPQEEQMKILSREKRKTEEKNGKTMRQRVRTYCLIECEKCKEQKWVREKSKTLKKETHLCARCMFTKEYFCKECGTKLPKKGEYCDLHKRSYCRKCGKQIKYLKHCCEDCKTIPRKHSQRMKEQKECAYCGNLFFPLYGGFRMYCSRDCGHKALKTLTPLEEEQRDICRRETKIYQRTGYLKPVECAICKTKENLHTHHYDYNKPNSVYILCSKHHTTVHHNNLDLSTAEKTECEWNAADIVKELRFKKTLTYKNDLLKKKRKELDKSLSILVLSLFGNPSTFKEVISKGTRIEAMIGIRHKSINTFRQEWCKERGLCKRCGSLVDKCLCSSDLS